VVVFDRFSQLHPDGRHLAGLLLRRGNREDDDFLSFFMIWMSFNGWMACVTARDRDADMVGDIAEDLRLSLAFRDVCRRNDQFRETVDQFATFWPVFNAKSVKRHFGEEIFAFRDRDNLVERALLYRQVQRRPADWVPGDQPRWGDLIWVIYQVRCNLFHGSKSPVNWADAELVRLSSSCLKQFLDVVDPYGGD
jgi:hypothetical protein